MSPESLQTIIVAVVAVLLLSQTTMLIGSRYRLSGSVNLSESFLLTRVSLLESRGAEPNDWMSLWRRLLK